MKALSICEPWASAIVSGKKNTECRNWQTHFRGEFLIHTSKRYDGSAPGWLKQLYPLENCKLGFIIGKATLLDVHEYTSDREFEADAHFHLCKWTPEELGDDLVEYSRYGFIIIDAKPIEPIQAKGALNFWNFTGVLK